MIDTMSNQSTNEKDDEQQPVTNGRPVCFELLTKIYYPDTLYPDNYTFFADRESSQIRSIVMDLNDQQHSTTDTARPLTNLTPIPEQPIAEVESSVRQSEHPVSVLFAFKKGNL